MTIDTMMTALRESQTVPTKREAGRILAAGGWAVFPLPDAMKFDTGRGALTYKHATKDPREWDAMCDMQMAKSECRDVNIALAPAYCAVPLLVIDLDGSNAISSFFDDATARGHIDIGLWLRVNTTRPDFGRHLYFVSPDGTQYGNSIHRWGGDVRSAKGHVVMPPSTTGLGRYTWVGEKLYSAPEWVVEGLVGKPLTASPDMGNDVSDDDVFTVLEAFSHTAATSYGQVALDNLLAEFDECVPGAGQLGRNPTLQRVLRRALDLAMDGHLDAIEAVKQIHDAYSYLVSGDPTHPDPTGEVRRTVASWVRNKTDVLKTAEAAAGAAAWVAGRSTTANAADLLKRARESRGALAPKATEYLRAAQAHRATQPRLFPATHDWHKDVNK